MGRQQRRAARQRQHHERDNTRRRERHRHQNLSTHRPELRRENRGRMLRRGESRRVHQRPRDRGCSRTRGPDQTAAACSVLATSARRITSTTLGNVEGCNDGNLDQNPLPGQTGTTFSFAYDADNSGADNVECGAGGSHTSAPAATRPAGAIPAGATTGHSPSATNQAASKQTLKHGQLRAPPGQPRSPPAAPTPSWRPAAAARSNWR